MKKLFTLFALGLVLVTGCASKKKAQEEAAKQAANLEFEYKAITRGSQYNVVISKAGIWASTVRGNKPEAKKIESVQWDELVKLYNDNVTKKGVKLEELEAPSKKHQFDGAMAANLTVRSGEQATTSITFDHGNPPAQIKPVVDKIVQLAGFEK